MYDRTGMPAARAFSVGEVKAVLSITGTAIPSAFDVIALFIASTISETIDFDEPVQL